jgi:hypothetical protein
MSLSFRFHEARHAEVPQTVHEVRLATFVDNIVLDVASVSQHVETRMGRTRAQTVQIASDAPRGAMTSAFQPAPL